MSEPGSMEATLFERGRSSARPPAPQPAWKTSLRSIVERSSFLHERLGGNFQPGSGDATAARKRLEDWKVSCALGDQALFQGRLAWEGWTEESVLPFLGPLRLASEEIPSQPWVSFLARLLNRLATGPWDLQEMRRTLQSLRGDRPAGFEELLLPFVLVAREDLRQRSGSIGTLLAREAHRQLEQSLLFSLESVSSETYDLEFTVFRTIAHAQSRPGTEGAWFGSLPGSPARELYDQYLQRMLAGPYQEFLEEYAVLARLMAVLASSWTANTLEFLRALDRDLPGLREKFNEGRDLGAVTSLEPGLSDRHNGGRTALRVSFDSGVHLIYKPKDLQAEEAFSGLLDFVNREQGLPLLKGVRVLNRGTHGWVEEIQHLPCESIDEVERYYRRAGILLCLMFVLEGGDCHHENVIASGEFPVLIDTETLLQHRVRPAEIEGAQSLANREFYWDSVFRTALLPRWEFGPAGESYDVSGLGGVEAQETNFRRKSWEQVNTDAARLRYEIVATRPRHNVVQISGRTAAPGDYVDQIVSGFREMYESLLSRRKDLFAPEGPLQAFDRLPVRFIFRHTKIYSSVLSGIFHPQFLREGVDASVCVDVLSRALLQGSRQTLPLIRAEHRALLACDIPSFRALSSSDALGIGPQEELPGFFSEPSFSLLVRRFEKLNRNDLEQQISYIRASFESRTALEGGRATSPVASTRAEGSTYGGRSSWQQAGLDIAERICSLALTSRHGGATWITLAYYADAQRWQLQPMTPRLYDGTGGVALFLAASFKVSGNSEFRRLALEALREVLQQMDRPDFQRMLFEPGIGAGVGGASVVYALARSATWLGETELLQGALRLARTLTPERIAADRRFDVMGGAAGAILALSALWELSKSDEMLAMADACGRHLLDHRAGAGNGLRAWPTLNGNFHTGFSHGAAGIAWSLLRLYAATGDSQYREAAREACAYEDSLFDPAAKNWLDLRSGVSHDSSYRCSWCHGAPGIGLGRLVGLSWLDTPVVRKQIRAALETTESSDLELDHLCCGNLGRASILLSAARHLHEPSFEESARRITDDVLERARTQGGFSLGWKSIPYLPSCHQGMAGIGYHLLRMAAPETLPDILVWE